MLLVFFGKMLGTMTKKERIVNKLRAVVDGLLNEILYGPRETPNAFGLNSELVLKSYQVAEMDDAEIDRMSDEELELFLTTPVGEKPTLDKLPFYGE